MTELDLFQVNICTGYSTESEEKLLTLINSARDVSKPNCLTNEDVYFYEDDIEEYNLVYSTDEPGEPDDPFEYSSISSDIIGDDRFHVHSIVEDDCLDTVVNTHMKMVASAGEIDVSYIGIGFRVDESIENIIDEIDFIELSEDAPQMDAINFVDDEFDVTIRTGSSETFLSAVEPEIGTIEASKLEEEVNKIVEKAGGHLNEVIS